MHAKIIVISIEEHSSVSLKKTIAFHTAAKTLAQFPNQKGAIIHIAEPL